jgi:hypothetical protein
MAELTRHWPLRQVRGRGRGIGRERAEDQRQGRREAHDGEDRGGAPGIGDGAERGRDQAYGATQLCTVAFP